MTTPGSTIEVAFPKVDTGSQELVVPPVINTPVNTGLAGYAATAETRRTLSCKDLLQGDTLARAEREATDLLDKMLANTQIFMVYGTTAVQGVNDLIDQLLHQVEPVKIPELTALMHDLNKGMRAVKNKYDVSDPKVREKYEHWKGGIGRLWGQAKTLIELFMEDITSIESQLNKVEAQLKGKQYQLIRYVGFYDELYKDNEEELLKLIYVIGVMELIRDQAAHRAAAIQVGDATRGDRAGEQRAALAQFAENMSIKITEYKGRLAIGWATSPNVRMMRSLDVTIAERLNELVCVTIPTMKATLVQWRMLMATMDAADFVKVVATASNEWTTAYFKASGQLMPIIADIAETPTLLPQTVMAMAESIETAANGIIAAMDAGERRRVELDAAIIQGHDAMVAAGEKLTDSVVDRVVGAATKPLEIATSVPATASAN